MRTPKFDSYGRVVRIHDRVAILPDRTDVHQDGHHYGDVTGIGAKLLHVRANSGQTVHVAPSEVMRINI